MFRAKKILMCSRPISGRKTAWQCTLTDWNQVRTAQQVLELCPTSSLFQKGKVQLYILCSNWTNLCYLQRNLAFSFTNRKSLMLGFYFKHALKLWVFRRMTPCQSHWHATQQMAVIAVTRVSMSEQSFLGDSRPAIKNAAGSS